MGELGRLSIFGDIEAVSGLLLFSLLFAMNGRRVPRTVVGGFHDRAAPLEVGEVVEVVIAIMPRH